MEQTFKKRSNRNNYMLSKQIFFTNILLIFISYDEVSSNQVCKPEGSSWEEDNTLYRSFIYKKDLYAYAICKAGFTTSSSSKVLCVNGVWENPLPRCERVTSSQCEPLRFLEKVIKKCDDHAPSVGSICSYRCPNGYFLKGSSRRVCGVNLQWTGIEPQCILIGSHNTINSVSPPSTTSKHSNDSLQSRQDLINAVKNTCERNNGGCEDICNFTSGSVRCSCRSGYKLINDKNCTDINECQERHHCNHVCVNTIGSYVCQCNPGYVLKNWGQCRKIETIPVSEFNYAAYSDNQRRDDKRKIVKSCAINNGGCEQICGYSNGIATCSCKIGYSPLQEGKCKDIDECKERRNYCAHTCINTQGSYKCECNDGYVLKSYYHCVKEVLINPTVATGYSPRNQKHEREITVDVDECKENNGGCREICTNVPGSYICSCSNGYTLENDGKTCIDINECRYNNGGCSDDCINFIGSYHCSCPDGFRLRNDGKTCIDINECRYNKGGCSDDCINVPGSFHCSCPAGFRLSLDGKTCIDIDECLTHQANQCNQKCLNTPGSYMCSCEPGYILKNKYECEGCRKNSYKSDTNNVCVECPLNTETDSIAKSSIADCHCLPGFVGDPLRQIPCDDVNECFQDNFGCSDFCINTQGSALCSCPIGYELKNDNKTCVDTDECQVKNGGCETFCHNFLGSFNCSCSNGYTLAEDKYSCIDENECDFSNGGCSDICNNFPGGYYCSCRKGFRLHVDGKACSAVRCLSVAVPHHSTLRCKVNGTKVTSKPNDITKQNPTDHSFGTICKVKCSKGFNISVPYDKIECLENGSWNATTPQCIASHCPALKIPANGSVYPLICKEGFVPVQQKCYITCNSEYEIDETGGESIVKCKNDLTWTKDPPSCKPVHTAASVICPKDVTEDLGWNESSENIFIPQPNTNMEIIEIYPDWVKPGQNISIPSGQTNVLFKGRNFDSSKTAQCIMTINVIDRQPPMFIMCPESFSVSDVGYQGVVVSWDEPVAFDNVAIQSVVKNLEPNSTLSSGVHFVEYTAHDAAGNIAKCAFQINITRSHCKDLDNPENGTANCIAWLNGRLCRPACDSGYERDPGEPKFFACGDSGQWTPEDIISPCLPICLNETIWSTTTNSCEEKEELLSIMIQ